MHVKEQKYHLQLTIYFFFLYLCRGKERRIRFSDYFEYSGYSDK